MDCSCTYCKSPDLVELSEGLFCRTCGCDQRMPQMIMSYDMVSHVEAMPDSFYYNKSLSKQHSNAIQFAIDYYQQQLSLGDGLVETAKKLLIDYIQAKDGLIIVREIPAYVAVAIYFSSHDCLMPLSRKRIIDLAYITSDEFSKAYQAIKDTLTNNSVWGPCVHSAKKTAAIEISTAYVVIRKLFANDKAMMVTVRGKVNKVFDKIQEKAAVKSLQPTTIAAALVFVGVKAAKVKGITMAKVAKIADVTSASIINAISTF